MQYPKPCSLCNSAKADMFYFLLGKNKTKLKSFRTIEILHRHCFIMLSQPKSDLKKWFFTFLSGVISTCQRRYCSWPKVVLLKGCDLWINNRRSHIADQFRRVVKYPSDANHGSEHWWNKLLKVFWWVRKTVNTELRPRSCGFCFSCGQETEWWGSSILFSESLSRYKG